MCGIAGVINCPSITPRDVEAMVAAIRHRGPDDQGVRQLRRCIVGHARLAVVDPVRGAQPMPNGDETVWVVFNGEIYNFVELRAELVAKGYRFRSRCDTEVLVHLWRECGEDMLCRLNGMFSFFLWDEAQDRGILARDRVGIKPCYLMPLDGGLAFCSEIKGLLRLPGAQARVSATSLVHTLAFNYCPRMETCFEGVSQLAPGSCLRFHGNSAPVCAQYWQWPFRGPRQTPEPEEFDGLLADSARLQLRFDVPGGVLLSGGVDSAIVAAHVRSREPQRDLLTLSLDVLEPGFGEYEQACAVGAALGMRPEPLAINADVVATVFPDVVRHAEQPHGDFSFALFYLLAREAHQRGVIVLFSGDGPDEPTLGFAHNSAFFGGPGGEDWLARYHALIRYTTDAELAAILQPDVLRQAEHPITFFEQLLASWSDLAPPEQVAAYECTTLMPLNNLVKADRMGARWATEGRSLLLDHRVLEALARMPLEQKLSKGIGKRFLKGYASTLLDGVDFYRPKSMPTAPVGQWLRGRLHPWARDIFARADQRILNRGALLSLLEAHCAGEANHTRPLRVALSTALWLEEFSPA